MNHSQTHRSALSVLTSLFFFWGFVASANDVLIPLFKNELQLEQWQSQWISFVFYVAYTSGTLFYVMISKLSGRDLLQKTGYRNGMVIGLGIASLGTLFFIPASLWKSFYFMLAGLYVMGLGFSLMQTVANALIICLGNPEKSSQRLSLAGGINNIGSTLGPLIVGNIVFSESHLTTGGISQMYIPYIIMGFAFILMAWWFRTSSVPQHISQESNFITNDNKSAKKNDSKIFLSMLAIFFYVGVEVSTVANMPEFLRTQYQIPVSDISVWVALYWAGLMMGRWADSSVVFIQNRKKLFPVKILMAFSGFLFFMVATLLGNKEIRNQVYFAFFIPMFLWVDFLTKTKPERQLMYFSIAGAICILFSMMVKHPVAVYVLVLSGMFCSTLWPAIFSLALQGEESRASVISVRLIMMVMGGGIISLLQGYLMSLPEIGVRMSYLINVICFLYLCGFGFYMSKRKNLLTN
jgi:FHS family L-fucose permease-like MFS transporter